MKNVRLREVVRKGLVGGKGKRQYVESIYSGFLIFFAIFSNEVLE